MTSLYTLDPSLVDKFRKWVADVDDMTAEDLTDLFDAIIAVEAELGLNPSGNLGSIYSRLFGRRIWSTVDGGWRSLESKLQGNFAESDFDEFSDSDGVAFTLADLRYRNHTTVFGEGVPAVFIALQDTGLNTTPAANYALNAPWSTMLHKLEADDFGTLEFRVHGRDGGTNTTAPARLQAPDARTDITIGWISWSFPT